MSRSRARVLVLTRWYPTEKRPGDFLFVRDWAETAAMIADVAVLHLDRTDEAAGGNRREVSRVPADIPTFRLPAPIEDTALCRVAQLAREWRGVVVALDNIETLTGFRADLVHVHSFTAAPHAMWIRLRRGIPYVVTEHYSRFPRRDMRWYHLLQAWIALPLARRIVPVSPGLGAAMRACGVLGRYTTIPNPVQVHDFSPGPGEREREVGTWRFVCVTRLEWLKGVDVLLDALAGLPLDTGRWELDLIGDGNLREEFVAQAARLGIQDRVRFLGRLARPSIASAMREADVVIVPSRVETFSVVAAEGLASGTPVLATASGGPEYFVGPDHGHTVRPGDADDLRRGLMAILDDYDTYDPAVIIEHAREQFSRESVARRLSVLYDEVRRGS